jgi:hypothetical protein
MIVKMPSLRNAQQLSRLRPEQFEVPNQERLDRVGTGSLVKICAIAPHCDADMEARGERFWVEVTARWGNRLTGRVDNELVQTEEHGLSYGDLVEFLVDNIYDVYD